jgi:hypothetical protein
MNLKPSAALLMFLPAIVFAQTIPNMIGTWKGTFNATVMGSAAHHILPKKADDDITFNKVPFSLIIERQDDLNFYGTLSTSNHKEIILGAIAPDLQGGVMVDGDGTHNFKIIDSTTIQNCYVQLSKPKIAACWIGKKQK